MDFVNEKATMKMQAREEAPRNPAGSLHRPTNQDGKVRGDHPGYVMKTSLYTRATIHPVLAGVAVASILGTAILALQSFGDGQDGKKK
jgi:hypothetical protein